jgi:hypothetical protein
MLPTHKKAHTPPSCDFISLRFEWAARYPISALTAVQGGGGDARAEGRSASIRGGGRLVIRMRVDHAIAPRILAMI